MLTVNAEKLDKLIECALSLAVNSPLILVLITLKLINLNHLQNNFLDVVLSILIGICAYNILKSSVVIFNLGSVKNE